MILVDEYGPADRSWLLKEVERDLFDKAGTLSLQAPQNPLPEPAATVSTNSAPGPTSSLVASSASGNPIDRVYAAAQAMSARNLPYIYGGGHTGSWATAATAAGYDCSSSTSMVLYAAGLMTAFPGPLTSARVRRVGCRRGRDANDGLVLRGARVHRVLRPAREALRHRPRARAGRVGPAPAIRAVFQPRRRGLRCRSVLPAALARLLMPADIPYGDPIPPNFLPATIVSNPTAAGQQVRVQIPSLGGQPRLANWDPHGATMPTSGTACLCAIDLAGGIWVLMWVGAWS